MAFVEVGKRSPSIDMARGVGALLVVFGHSFTGTPQAAVYLFHMPLFFLLSGLLFQERAWPVFFASRLRNLVLPSLAFALLVAIAAVAWSGILHSSWSPSVAEKAAKAKGMFVVFWFPLALLIGEISLNASQRFGKPGNIIIGLTLTISYIGAWFGIKTPLSLFAALHCIAMLRAGMILRGVHIARPWPWFVAALAAIACGLFAPGLSYNMKEEYFGVPVVSFLVSIIISVGILLVCEKLKRLKNIENILSLLGSNALALMFLQQPIQVTLLDLGVTSEMMRFALTAFLSTLIAVLMGRVPLFRVIMFGRWRPVRQT